MCEFTPITHEKKLIMIITITIIIVVEVMIVTAEL